MDANPAVEFTSAVEPQRVGSSQNENRQYRVVSAEIPRISQGSPRQIVDPTSDDQFKDNWFVMIFLASVAAKADEKQMEVIPIRRLVDAHQWAEILDFLRVPQTLGCGTESKPKWQILVKNV